LFFVGDGAGSPQSDVWFLSNGYLYEMTASESAGAVLRTMALTFKPL
jgi:hypothetical protein